MISKGKIHSFQCKSLKDLSPHSTTSSSSGVSSSSSNSSTSSGSARSSHYGSVNSSTLSSSHNSSMMNHKDKRASWNPFKKASSRDKLRSAESLNDCNLILR